MKPPRGRHFQSDSAKSLLSLIAVTKKRHRFGFRKDWHFEKLPWVGAGSARVEKEVRNIVCSSYPCVKLYLVFGTMREFSVRKDVLPTLSRSNLIYFFSAENVKNGT